MPGFYSPKYRKHPGAIFYMKFKYGDSKKKKPEGKIKKCPDLADQTK